jgi:hypothetical protein
MHDLDFGSVVPFMFFQHVLTFLLYYHFPRSGMIAKQFPFLTSISTMMLSLIIQHLELLAPLTPQRYCTFNPHLLKKPM